MHIHARTNARTHIPQVKEVVLAEALRAKFTQHSTLGADLLATGSKTIVMVDQVDQWGGMNAAGGIATGKNRVGKLLMQVRSELAPPSPSQQ